MITTRMRARYPWIRNWLWTHLVSWMKRKEKKKKQRSNSNPTLINWDPKAWVSNSVFARHLKTANDSVRHASPGEHSTDRGLPLKRPVFVLPLSTLPSVNPPDFWVEVEAKSHPYGNQSFVVSEQRMSAWWCSYQVLFRDPKTYLAPHGQMSLEGRSLEKRTPGGC